MKIVLEEGEFVTVTFAGTDGEITVMFNGIKAEWPIAFDADIPNMQFAPGTHFNLDPALKEVKQ